jgi:hypothetical protein
VRDTHLANDGKFDVRETRRDSGSCTAPLTLPTLSSSPSTCDAAWKPRSAMSHTLTPPSADFDSNSSLCSRAGAHVAAGTASIRMTRSSRIAKYERWVEEGEGG